MGKKRKSCSIKGTNDSKEVAYTNLLNNLNPSYVPSEIPSLLKKQSGSISSSENSSVLIIGPPGSGKSLLVSHAITHYLPMICKDFKYQVVYIRGEFLTNENSCHIQLKTQLELQSYTVDDVMEIEEEMKEDIEEEEEEEEESLIAKNLLYLEERLIENKRKGICTIFVVDGFEQACMKSKRTLYHIANASHLSTSHLIIIGLTACYNIESLIDKRTLSRLLSRRIFTYLPKNIDQIKTILTERLLIDTNEDLKMQADENKDVSHENQLITSFISYLSDRTVMNLLQRSLASGSNIVFYLKWTTLTIHQLQQTNSCTFTPKLFSTIYESLTINPLVNMIQDLSIYELCTLLACKKCEEYGSKSSNNFISYSFDIAYNEYCKFVTGGANNAHISDSDLFRDKLMSSLSVNKSIVLTSFEKLLELGFLKLSSVSKKLLDAKDRKRGISSLPVRLNNLHPIEIDNYLKGRKEQLNSEIYRWAIGG